MAKIKRRSASSIKAGEVGKDVLWLKRTCVSLLILMAATLALSNSGVAFSQQPNQYRATFEVPDAPTEGRVGLRAVFPRITIKNSGTLGWPAGGANEVRLGYRWFYSYGALIPKQGNWEELRASLPVDIPVGQSIIFPDFQVAVPSQPGDYILHLDLVFPNGDRYFQQLGSTDYTVKVTVKPRDTAAPTAQIATLPLYTTATTFPVNWSGKDDDGGSGVAVYDVQYKTVNDTDWQNWLSGTTLTSATFNAENGKLYQFRVRAIDRAGNASAYPANEMAATRVDSLPPTSKVDTLLANNPAVFLVRWSSFDNLSGVGLYDVQYREGNGDWQDWLSGTPATASPFQGQAGKSYSFRVRAADYAGNQEEYTNLPQATTNVIAPASSVYGSPAAALTTGGKTTYYFPLSIKNGDQGAGITGIVVQNPGSQPVQVSVQYNNREGAPASRQVNGQDTPLDAGQAATFARVDTVVDTIAAGGSRTFWAGNLAIPFYNGWVAVAASAPVNAASVRLAANGSSVTYAAASAANTLYLPYFSKGNSVITLANSSATAADVEVRYYSPGGALFASEKRPLARLGSARFGLTGSDQNARFTGSVVISSNQPIAGTVETTLEDGSVISYPAQITADTKSADLPVYKDVNGYTTSLVIQNPDKDPITARIEYLDNSGASAGTFELQLAGNGQTTVWQGNLQGANFTGKVRVTTAKGRVVATVVGAGAGFKGRSYL